MYKRIFLIVIDSVGCGTAPLSYKFGDDGANNFNALLILKKLLSSLQDFKSVNNLFLARLSSFDALSINLIFIYFIK